MKRKKFTLTDYETPKMEFIDVETEQCFAASTFEIDEMYEEEWSW